MTPDQGPRVYSALRWWGTDGYLRPLWGQTKACLRLASCRGAVSRLDPKNGRQGSQKREFDHCSPGTPLVCPPAPWRWGGLRALMRPPCTQESGSTKEALPGALAWDNEGGAGQLLMRAGEKAAVSSTIHVACVCGGVGSQAASLPLLLLVAAPGVYQAPWPSSFMEKTS